tara:strand:- start:97 stop:336 length:240 start_codon:yes stop_codon:yes gene_type:complete
MLSLDAENFTYDRSWEQIESMLEKAETKQTKWIMDFHNARANNDKETMKECARNKKALEGVIKTLRWTLGDRKIQHPLN